MDRHDSAGARPRLDPLDYPICLSDAAWLRLPNLAAAMRATSILGEPPVQGISADIDAADLSALLAVFADHLEAVMADHRHWTELRP